MSDLTLGTTPARLTVWLVDAAPFAASVTAGNPFPAPPELVFDTGTVWPATLSGDGLTAAWLHPAADVNALAALSPRRVTLRDPASHHVWAHGTVYVARVVDSGEASTIAPGGSITVDTLDGNVSITYGGGGGSAFELRGTGMPNGVVTADPGTYYTDEVGTAGAWRWLKKTGAGPTGWEVIHGDTGERNCYDLFYPGLPLWNAPQYNPQWNSILLRRIGPMVTIDLKTTSGPAAGSWDHELFALPPGFRPVQELFNVGMDGVYTIGTTTVRAHNHPGVYAGCRLTNYSYLTSDPWPTTLPGVPA